MRTTVDDIIEKLGLVPHPEGGFFRETYRSGATPMASRGKTDLVGSVIAADSPEAQRNVLTSIYWVPTCTAPIGWWCLNRSDHVHYYQLGGVVEYHVVHRDGRHERVRLGPDLRAGQQLQLVVPGGAYKAARLVKGDFCVVGEAVAPGFDFRDFRWVTQDELAMRGHTGREIRDFVRPDPCCDFDAYYSQSEGAKPVVDRSS